MEVDALKRKEEKRKMIKTRGIKNIFVIMIIMVMLLGICIPQQKDNAYAADGKITIKVGKRIDYSSHFTHYFYAGEKDSPAYCAQPQLPGPASGSYTYDFISPTSMLAKCLYYGYGGPGFDEYTDKQLSGQWDGEDDAYCLTHIIVSIAYDETTSAASDPFYGLSGAWKTKAQDLYNYVKTLPAPPANYRAYLIKTAGCQDILGSFNDTGSIKLVKSSEDRTMTDNNTCYSLAGAQYGLYYGNTLIDTITTDANGVGILENVLVANYTIKEISASKGYALDLEAYNCTVTDGTTTTLDVKEQPKDDPIGILLEKGDAETGKALPQGSAKLSGAVYEIKYFKHTATGKSLDRTWRVKTDGNGIAHLSKDDLDTGFDNDEFFYSSAGDPCIPLGTVTVQEVQAPEGYLLNDTVYSTEITEDGGTVESVYTYNVPKIGSDPEVAEQVKRGDIEFVKVSDGTLERLAGVPFRITSLTTGESHTVVSDKNGYVNTASSWNKHTANTNRGETSEDGIWFGTAAPDDSKGALIYDDYELEELRCEANKGMKLLKIKVSVYKDSVTVPLGTLTDDIIEIGTTAKDGEDGDKEIKTDRKITIIDTVAYKGLTPGQQYKLKGILMSKTTGEPLLNGGKEVTAEMVFTAKKSEGSVDVTFVFDGSSLQEQELVVFEKLYAVEGDLEVEVASHEDIEDKGQTVKLLKEMPSTPKTGDDIDLKLLLAIGLAAILLTSCLVIEDVRRRKKVAKESTDEETDGSGE